MPLEPAAVTASLSFHTGPQIIPRLTREEGKGNYGMAKLHEMSVQVGEGRPCSSRQ